MRKDFSPAWDGLARLAQRTGDEAKALEFFGKALEANPADARARLHRGQLHLGAGRLDQAVLDITEAARLRPEDPEVQLGLAEVRLRARMLDESLAAARRAAALTPRDPRVPALTAEIFLAMDALSESAEAAQAALTLDPGQPRALLALGEALGRQGKLPEALAALTPPDPAALAAEELADFRDAKARWQLRLEEQRRLEGEAARDDAPSETLLQLAEIRLAVSDFSAAADLASRAASHGLEGAALRRAAVILGQAGRLTEAERLLSGLTAGSEATADDWVNLGVLRELTGAPGLAGEAYRRALELPKAPADAHAGLARLALARGDRKEAAAALRAYLDSNPPLEYTARTKEALSRLEEAK